MSEAANARGFDHLVLCVDDLDAARAAYEALGFTTTPRAVHPFGTGNFLVQLRGCFLELLTVVDSGKIAAPAPGDFSFGDYNHRFLSKHEGFSMLALRCRDAAADRAAFAAAGLDTYPLFAFEREAKLPDGSAVTVGFALAFVTDPRMPEAAFFCCQHRHRPADFYKPDFQEHANGAIGIAEVIMAAEDPGEFADFFRRLQGGSAVRSEEGALTVDAGAGRITVLAADRLRRRVPDIEACDRVKGAHFVGYRVAVDDLARARGLLQSRGVAFREGHCEEDGPYLQIGRITALGVVIELGAASQ